MNEVRIRAYGKINLGLDVVGKRDNGYHDVRMIMQTVGLYDWIIISKKKEPGITMEANLNFLPTDENNLVYKAVKLMMDHYHISSGVHIVLKKMIPVAAGMAGGSSDCAAALYGMNRLFNLGLSKRKLMEYGIILGADVPYCLMRGTALSEGIGEILTPLPPMPECYILIGKPQISVSTKFVYEHLQWDKVPSHPDIDGMVDALKQRDLSGVTERLGNVLETVTIPEYPIIQLIKDRMMELGAENALMSGSGPTVFGIFREKEKAENACLCMRREGQARHVYLVTPFNTKNGDRRSE